MATAAGADEYGLVLTAQSQSATSWSTTGNEALVMEVSGGGGRLIGHLVPRGLRVVHGALPVTDNAALELIDLTAPAWVDQKLALAGVPVRRSFEAEQLQHAAAVCIDAPRLPA